MDAELGGVPLLVEVDVKFRHQTREGPERKRLWVHQRVRQRARHHVREPLTNQDAPVSAPVSATSAPHQRRVAGASALGVLGLRTSLL
eukprot:493229-Prorocentrum_minimum.AAC.2